MRFLGGKWKKYNDPNSILNRMNILSIAEEFTFLLNVSAAIKFVRNMVLQRLDGDWRSLKHPISRR